MRITRHRPWAGTNSGDYCSLVITRAAAPSVASSHEPVCSEGAAPQNSCDGSSSHGSTPPLPSLLLSLPVLLLLLLLILLPLLLELEASAPVELLLLLLLLLVTAPVLELLGAFGVRPPNTKLHTPSQAPLEISACVCWFAQLQHGTSCSQVFGVASAPAAPPCKVVNAATTGRGVSALRRWPP